jgi:nucleoid DNA-binding protein
VKTVNFHLAYLLSKHECVIVPGFGAFVVSFVTENKSEEEGILCPPAFFPGFNPEIKHNDGLLANSIAKEKNISYREAVLFINQYVDKLWLSLNRHEVVQLPWIGELSLSEKHKISFSPARNLSCNAAYYGFSDIHLPYLDELRSTVAQDAYQEEKAKEIIWIPLHRKFIVYAGSVAAALLALFLVPTSLDNFVKQTPPIHAGIVSFPKEMPTSDNITEMEESITPDTVSVVKEIMTRETDIQPVQKSSRRFFIVIASLPNRKSAETTLQKFKSKGFENASIISSEGKHRIYINQFENKGEAESFLNDFREKNPDYSKTWLLGANV